MIPRHKFIAISIFLVVTAFVFWRDEPSQALARTLILLVFLLGILLDRLVAFFSGFGFPEYFARDFGSENRPGPYAFFFWMLFLIAAGMIVFDLSLF
jgi:hypothetical protein